MIPLRKITELIQNAFRYQDRIRIIGYIIEVEPIKGIGAKGFALST